MRRPALAVLSLSLLAGALTAPQALAADPLVTLTWADSTHKAVRVSWPTDDKANIVYVIREGVGVYDVETAAAGPDTVDIATTAFPANRRIRIDVRAKTSPTTTTTVGSTAVFDTDVRFDGFIRKLQPNTNSTLGLEWIYTGKPDDAADPLDMPTPISHLGGPIASTPTGCGWQQLATAPGSPASTTLASRPRPYKLGIRSNEEWGSLDSSMQWEIDDQAVSTTLPAFGAFNNPVTLQGKLELIRPGACVDRKPRPTVRTPYGDTYLTLQARSSSTAPWVQVANGIHTNPSTGRFEVDVRPLGTRQYRIFAPGTGEIRAASGLTGATFHGLSAATTLTTRYQLNTAKFYDPTVAPGQAATIALAVGPANNVRTTLQRWDGKAWVSIKWVYLTKGVARYTFPAPGRGNTAYRFVVPPTTYNGLPVAGITTGSIVLVVR
jgi:hypothetical protein